MARAEERSDGIRVLPARPEDARRLAPRLRAADRREIFAGGGVDGLTALTTSLHHSPLAWTGWVGGEPAALFGVARPNLLADCGLPWLLGSDLLVRHQQAFLRRCPAYLARMRRGHVLLHNWVDERNALSRRWLAWLGFRFDPPAPHGLFGLPFRRFWLEGLPPDELPDQDPTEEALPCVR